MLAGYSLGETETPCPYIRGEIFRSENYIFDRVDPENIDALLERGYRHFGKYFFRPVCTACHRCLPIRIPVSRYEFSRSAKQLLRRNADLQVEYIDKPEASRERYDLYRKHKKRFPEMSNDNDSYENFAESFFSNFPFSMVLEIRDKDRLVAVTHLDEGTDALSAIYCYYDTDYLSMSPGRYSLYQSLLRARKTGKSYFYLGYYIEENSHMSYKGKYRPNEILLEEGKWISGPGENHSFVPKYRLD